MAALSDGLLAYYSMDGDAGDSIGGHNGELMGDATFVPGPELKAGQALKLDGDQDYVEVPHDPAFDALSEEFTISAWVYLESNSDRTPVATKEHMPDANRGFNFWYDGGQLRMQLYGDVGKMTVISEGVLDTGRWYQVACTFKATGNEHKIFIDGDAQNIVEDTFEGTIQTNEQPIRIGAYIWDPNGYQKYLKGMIDDVAIYTRALSADEISSIASGTPIVGPNAVDPEDRLTTTWAAIR
jgi:hypothetical protein